MSDAVSSHPQPEQDIGSDEDLVRTIQSNGTAVVRFRRFGWRVWFRVRGHWIGIP